MVTIRKGEAGKMTEKSEQRERMAAAADALKNRVELSEALLERMGVSVEAFSRVLLNALLANPKLVECSKASLERAVVICIDAGLLPDGRQAAIVPYSGEAQVLPMIEGRLMLARRATPGLALRVRAVFDADEWEYSEGLVPVLIHKPDLNASRTEADLIACYAVGIIPGSQAPEFEVHSRADTDRYRAKSRASGRAGAPWNTEYVEMAKKTVLGQLLKRLPKRVGDPVFEAPEVADGIMWEDKPAASSPADVAAQAAAEEERPEPEPKAKAKPKRARRPMPKAEPEPEPEPEGPAGDYDSPF